MAKKASNFTSKYREKYDRCKIPVRCRQIDDETSTIIDIDLRNLHKPKKKRMIILKAKEKKTKKTSVFTCSLPLRSMSAGGVISAAIRQFIIQGCRLNEAKAEVMSLVAKHNKNPESYKRYFK